MRAVKFVTSGAIGVSVNLAVFHTLYVLAVPYLAGSIIALVLSMGVGFVLQKYWTFQNHSAEHVHVQFGRYALLALVNLSLNTGIVYVLIDTFGTFYLLAQAIGAATIGINSFFIYRAFIFPPFESDSESTTQRVYLSQ